jgi:carboxyl-terminal processing protease
MLYIGLGGVLGKSGADTANEKTYKDLGVYEEVLSRIKQDYVTEPNLNKVTDGAVRGLLESLDPYNTYFTAKEYQDYQAHPEPGPAGVGLFVSKKLGYTTVVSVLPDSPADKAGDLLDRVENESTRELSVVQLDRMLAGQSGSSLTVWVVKEARGEPDKVTMTRQVLAAPVVANMTDNNTAYLRVPTFNQGKAEEVSRKLKELIASNHADKVVLDLRNCAGGDVNEAVQTASLFLDRGLVTYAQGQRYPRQDVPVKPEGQVIKLPLVVLINQSTAGPAELVASAVLGNHRGDVVGVQSFGEGVVQKVIPVGDGSALLLSVAKYYGFDGKPIVGNGITPNVVAQSTADTASMDDDGNAPEEPEHLGGKDDLQLQKALEILKQQNAGAKAA